MFFFGTQCIYIAEKYISWATIPPLTIRVYLFIRLAVIASEAPKHEKYREIPREFDLIAVQGHRSWCQWKARM